MLEKMKEMLAEQLNCEASTITPETSFKVRRGYREDCVLAEESGRRGREP